MKDLGFLWGKTVNSRKRSIGEPLRIKGIASTRRGKYWKTCNKMHNHFSTSDAFLQRWKLEYDCQNVEAKSALLHSSVNPDYLQWLEGHFSSTFLLVAPGLAAKPTYHQVSQSCPVIYPQIRKNTLENQHPKMMRGSLDTGTALKRCRHAKCLLFDRRNCWHS